MYTYIVRRLFTMIPLLFAMSFVTFMFIRMIPGDVLAPYRNNPQISQETIHEMEHKFHFDKPAIVQYGYWLKSMVRLDFGYSFSKRCPVSSVIASHAVNTLYLALFSILITWCLGIPLGIWCAVHQYKLSDKVFSFLSYIGMSLPSFFLALLLMYLFSNIGDIPLIGRLPVGGMKSDDFDSFSAIGKFFDVMKHMIIPGIVLGIASIASLQRVMRGSMLEELRARYITTARAKGLPESRVQYVHALRNAINPLITLFGYELAGLLSGAALTEIITGWPGLGSIMLEAVRSQDVFLVMGNMMMGGILLIAGNLVADVALALSDPRIRLS